MDLIIFGNVVLNRIRQQLCVLPAACRLLIAYVALAKVMSRYICYVI